MMTVVGAIFWVEVEPWELPPAPLPSPPASVVSGIVLGVVGVGEKVALPVADSAIPSVKALGAQTQSERVGESISVPTAQ